jgi:hypothetical protein
VTQSDRETLSFSGCLLGSQAAPQILDDPGVTQADVRHGCAAEVVRTVSADAPLVRQVGLRCAALSMTRTRPTTGALALMRR